MKQIVQLEGSSHCGPIAACMVLDHFGMPWDVRMATKRFAEYDGQKPEEFQGVRNDVNMPSYLAETGLLVLYVRMGTPLVLNQEHNYYHVSHKPRENRIATWYRAYELIKAGYVAVVAYERDAGKHHYVCINDAFLRAGEHWLSIVCPIRGTYEEQTERFLLTVQGGGDAMEWTFAKRMPARFASAAEQAPAEEAAESGTP